uniref:MinD/ParA family ATP-binding protein n=1 Tax=Spirilliplanes yamanashiensis TaxID=42233 RepID=UPI003521F9BA
MFRPGPRGPLPDAADVPPLSRRPGGPDADQPDPPRTTAPSPTPGPIPGPAPESRPAAGAHLPPGPSPALAPGLPHGPGPGPSAAADGARGPRPSLGGEPVSGPGPNEVPAQGAEGPRQGPGNGQPLPPVPISGANSGPGPMPGPDAVPTFPGQGSGPGQWAGPLTPPGPELHQSPPPGPGPHQPTPPGPGAQQPTPPPHQATPPGPYPPQPYQHGPQPPAPQQQPMPPQPNMPPQLNLPPQPLPPQPNLPPHLDGGLPQSQQQPQWQQIPPGPYPPQPGPQPGPMPGPGPDYGPAYPSLSETGPDGDPNRSPEPFDLQQPVWTDREAPTADEFLRRRLVKPADPVAQEGARAAFNKIPLMPKLPPSRREMEHKRDIDKVRRNFGGLRQVTVVNPKGGAGKTVAVLLLAMTFGQNRGGYVLAWDNNETQGTLGMRAQQDFHSRTVRDLMRDMHVFRSHGRIGEVSQYVRAQGEGMFDVLASDESATAGEMLTANAFGEIREVVSRFYKLIFVDTGNNVRAQNWQAAMDATDQLVVSMSARNDSAETAARMLDHLEQSGRQRLVRQAISVVSMPSTNKGIDLPAIQRHFAARTRGVLLAPYEKLLDSGEPLRYGQLSSATKDAWLKIAAAVAEGL